MSEQKIPAPILDAFKQAAARDLEAGVHKGNEDEMSKWVDKLVAQLEAARKALSEVGQKRTAAEEDAEHYRHMAYGRAATIGLPEAQIRAADKAAQEAAAAPPVQVVPQPQAEPQITTEDPLGLGQLDHTAAHSLPEGVVR